ncbi:Murinoglobulin-2-like 1, partial [Homarus americanus]
VSVRVETSPEYELMEGSGTQGDRGRRSSCLPAQDKVVHTVKIKPLVIGEVNITVSAFVDYQYPEPCGSGDTSIHRREKTWTKYICSKDFVTGEDSLEAWNLETPLIIVEGSDRAWVTAVGDLLALSLENLGHLIRMPYGCGEQNMVNFAPNIYIMRYLEASSQTSEEASTKLLTFMKLGYQRELLYRRNDGSYSAFGNSDDSGSTWLTAFVLKSFAQAQNYIQIDTKGLNKTTSWLLEQQGSNGCFRSVGKVFSKSMKGGVGESDSPVPLTAYVMIALMEAGDLSCNPLFCPAAECIQASTSQDPYTLALKAYAMALAGLTEANTVLQNLLGQAIVAKNSTHWELPKGPRKSQAVEVEIAGYAIMAMLTIDAKKYEEQARRTIKWVTARRNGQGGFFSTQ